MPLAGTAALLNWSDVAEADRPEYYAWHVREHMVGRIGVPGFLRGRRYAAVRATSDFFQFYELADAAVLESAPYRALAGVPTPLTQRVTQRIVNSHRVVATQRLSVGAGQAGYLLTLRLLSDAVDAALFDANVTRTTAARIRDLPQIAGVHAFAAIDAPSRVVLVEGLSAPALDHAGTALRTALGTVAARVTYDLFHHEFTVTPDDAQSDREG
jgi:hypothetical protein